MDLDHAEILLGAIGLLTMIIFGTLQIFITKKSDRQNRLEKKKFDDLLATAEARAEEAKAALIEAVTEKLPDDISAQELSEQLSSKLEVAGDIIINQIGQNDAQLIEDLVKNYHKQALSQAKIQFWFSVFAATIGFTFILYSAFSKETDPSSMALTILPGVIIDVIAALFFQQAERTRQRATEFYDRLRTDSHAAMAQDLLNKIEDTQIRSIAQAQMALHLSGVITKDFDVTTLIKESKIKV